MKPSTTHSLEQVEALMWKESDILKDPNVGKERKKEALKKLKLLEKHFKDSQDKHINGKKYPVKKKPVDISKKDLLALIDSVGEPESEDLNVEEVVAFHTYQLDKIKNSLDESGVSPGSNRFTFVDKGWPEPKFVNRKTSIMGLKLQT